MQTSQNSIPESKHFCLEKIKGETFGAIARGEGGAFSIAGIIDLGGQTLIFDRFETPISVEYLRVASNFLASNPIPWIVNSHAHSDQWYGNQVFNENTIIYSKKAWQSMHTQHEYAVRDKADPAKKEEQLQDLQKQLTNETNPKKYQPIFDRYPSMNLVFGGSYIRDWPEVILKKA